MAVKITVWDACAAHASHVGAVVKITLVGRLHGAHVVGTAVMPRGVTPVFALMKSCAAVKITFRDACAVHPCCGCCGGARWHRSGARALSLCHGQDYLRGRLRGTPKLRVLRLRRVARLRRSRGSGRMPTPWLGEVVLAAVPPPPSMSAASKSAICNMFMS